MKFNPRKVERDASEAACLHVSLDEVLDDYTFTTIGPQPEVPVPPNPPDTTEEQQKLRAAEEDLTKHPSPWVLYTILGCLFTVEAIACVLLMDSLGLENPARVVFGFMCAAIIFLLTGTIARLDRSASVSAAGSGSGMVTAPVLPHRGRLRMVLVMVYAALIVAITVLRLDDMEGTEDTSLLYDLSAAIVLTCLTMGIAWLAELVMHRIVPMIPIMRDRSLRLRRIEAATREHARNVAALARATAYAKRWKDVAEQLQATYRHRYTIVERAINGGGPAGGAHGNGTARAVQAPVVAETEGTPS